MANGGTHGIRGVGPGIGIVIGVIVGDGIRPLRALDVVLGGSPRDFITTDVALFVDTDVDFDFS